MNTIEQKMYAERIRSRCLCWGVAVIFLIFFLLASYTRLKPLLAGVSVIHSRKALETYMEGDYGVAELDYAESENVGSAVLTETHVTSIALLGSGYIEAPAGSSSKEIRYQIWRLSGDGYEVLYCTPYAMTDSGSVHVLNRAPEVHAELIEHFAADPDSCFVLFASSAGRTYWPLALFGLATAAFLLLPLHFRHSKRYLMHSHLGRELTKYGRFEDMVQQFSPEFCRFQCSTLELYDRWLLFKYSGEDPLDNTFVWIVQPIETFELLGMERDEDEEDEYLISFRLNNCGRTFRITATSQQIHQSSSPLLPH